MGNYTERCQTLRSNMQITAEIIMQTYDLLKFAIACTLNLTALLY